jgi:hypothetical protein
MQSSVALRSSLLGVLLLSILAILALSGCGPADDENLPGPATEMSGPTGPPYGSDGVEYDIRMDVEKKMKEEKAGK